VREDVRPEHQERGGEPVGLPFRFPTLGSFALLLVAGLALLCLVLAVRGTLSRRVDS
jgi:hypothetical protein